MFSHKQAQAYTLTSYKHLYTFLACPCGKMINEVDRRVEVNVAICPAHHSACSAAKKLEVGSKVRIRAIKRN